MLCRKVFKIDISHLTSQTVLLHALTLFLRRTYTIKPYNTSPPISMSRIFQQIQQPISQKTTRKAQRREVKGSFTEIANTIQRWPQR